MQSFGNLVLGLIFAALLGVVVFYGVRAWRERARNNQQPIEFIAARVSSVRTETIQQPKDIHPKAAIPPSVKQFVAFTLTDGRQVELLIPGEAFKAFAEGQSGRLRFQGTRFLGFEPQP
jgi:hypothetical protein